MTLPPRLRLCVYLLAFAWRDIFPLSFYGRDARERLRSLFGSLRSCVSAFLNLITLTVLVLTTALVAALYAGTVGWLRDYVDGNPLARTVEISSIFSTRTAALGAEELEELRRLEVEGEPAPIAGVYGWNDVTLWLYDSHGSQDDSLTHGRTVDPNDPVLGRLELGTGSEAGSGRFHDAGHGQVIVSASLLEALGYGREVPLSGSIRVEYFDVAAPLEVVAVASDTPGGDFLITEAFHRSIQDRRWDPLPRVPGLYWGPVMPSAALDGALEKLGPWLRRQRTSAELVRRAGPEQWLRIEREEPWTEELWRQLFVPVFLEQLAQVEPAGGIELFEPVAPELRPLERLEPEFTRASIYVEELATVPAISDAVSRLGFRVTSNSRELALLFLQVSALGRRILLSVILVVGGLAAVSLMLSFSQSIQRKTPEIALLSAHGASGLLVLSAYVLEAVILWALSTAAGLLLAGIAARWLDQRLILLLGSGGGLAAGSETGLVS
ncbi:MAG: hypothetical protein MI919_39515, partial [Holophagales bacterium]|nr:hypothetical protein [Holophagales bacterium]